MGNSRTLTSDLDAGFTLLELMVALTLLSFLTLLLYETAHMGIAVWHRSTDALTGLSKVRNAQASISHDLEYSYPRLINDGRGSYITFDGAPDQITMLTADRAQPGVFSQVTIGLNESVDGFSLFRKSVSELSRDKVSNSEKLLEHVQSIKFMYYGALDDQRPVWLSTWKNKASLPQLIRVQIVLRGRSGAPALDWMVSPRLAADVSCILDVVTHTCRGL